MMPKGGNVLMPIQFRNYKNKAGITKDYHRVRKFFVNLGYSEFTYARWGFFAAHDGIGIIGTNMMN